MYSDELAGVGVPLACVDSTFVTRTAPPTAITAPTTTAMINLTTETPGFALGLLESNNRGP